MNCALRTAPTKDLHFEKRSSLLAGWRTGQEPTLTRPLPSPPERWQGLFWLQLHWHVLLPALLSKSASLTAAVSAASYCSSCCCWHFIVMACIWFASARSRVITSRICSSDAMTAPRLTACGLHLLDSPCLHECLVNVHH